MPGRDAHWDTEVSNYGENILPSYSTLKLEGVHFSETLVATCLRVKENHAIKILGLIGEMGVLKSRTNTHKRKFALYQQRSLIRHLRYIEFP